eukprot:2446479-Prymnesium_polylepis.1
MELRGASSRIVARMVEWARSKYSLVQAMIRLVRGTAEPRSGQRSSSALWRIMERLEIIYIVPFFESIYIASRPRGNGLWHRDDKFEVMPTEPEDGHGTSVTDGGTLTAPDGYAEGPGGSVGTLSM